jgi:hypothetical protein
VKWKWKWIVYKEEQRGDSVINHVEQILKCLLYLGWYLEFGTKVMETKASSSNTRAASVRMPKIIDERVNLCIAWLSL